jgi:hypothetical protein
MVLAECIPGIGKGSGFLSCSFARDAVLDRLDVVEFRSYHQEWPGYERVTHFNLVHGRQELANGELPFISPLWCNELLVICNRWMVILLERG